MVNEEADKAGKEAGKLFGLEQILCPSIIIILQSENKEQILAPQHKFYRHESEKKNHNYCPSHKEIFDRYKERGLFIKE